MKVTAIMPTYNQGDYLDIAIASVATQVDQLVVVDDGSTDNTPELLRAWVGLELITHSENRGTAHAINTGFEAATGDLVTWVSSDNIYASDWREILEWAFTEEADLGVAYSAFRYGIDGNILHTMYDPDRLVHNQNCFFGPSFMIAREVWEQAGPHRGKISHDYDHWLRVEEACWDMRRTIVSLPEVLCDYRVHDERATVQRKDQYDADRWQIEAMERRAFC